MTKWKQTEAPDGLSIYVKLDTDGQHFLLTSPLSRNITKTYKEYDKNWDKLYISQTYVVISDYHEI